MAVVVVDLLEAVEVEVEHGDPGALLPRDGLDRLAEAVGQQRAIGQPGQGIVQGDVGQPGFVGSPFGDVHQVHHQRLGLARQRSHRALHPDLVAGLALQPPLGGGHRLVLLRDRTQHPPHGVAVVAMHETQALAADQAARVVADQLAERWIGIEHDADGIDEQHRDRRLVEGGGEALLGGPHRLLALVAGGDVTHDDHHGGATLVLDTGGGRLDRHPALVIHPDQMAFDVGQPGAGVEAPVALGHRLAYRRRYEFHCRSRHQHRQVFGADQAQRLLVGEDEPGVLDHQDRVGGELDERAVALLRSAQLVHFRSPLSDLIGSVDTMAEALPVFERIAFLLWMYPAKSKSGRCRRFCCTIIWMGDCVRRPSPNWRTISGTASFPLRVSLS